MRTHPQRHTHTHTHRHAHTDTHTERETWRHITYKERLHTPMAVASYRRGVNAEKEEDEEEE